MAAQIVHDLSKPLPVYGRGKDQSLKFRVTERHESVNAQHIRGFIITDGKEACIMTEWLCPSKLWARLRAGKVYEITFEEASEHDRA